MGRRMKWTRIQDLQADRRPVRNRSYRRCFAVLVVTSLFFIYALSLADFDYVNTFVVAEYNPIAAISSYINLSIIKSSEATDATNNSLNLSCGYLVRSEWDGGVGNQMFYYASFYGIVHKSNASKVVFAQFINETPFLLDDIFENLSVPRHILPYEWLDENEFAYIDDYDGCCKCNWSGIDELACDGKNVAIVGWRQSYKYFDHVADDVKEEFTFKVEIREQCQRVFERRLSENRLYRNECIVIGTHLRRGDFTQSHKAQFGHEPASEEYLTRAIRFYETKFYGQNTTCVVFMVFGDDYEWNVNASTDVALLKPNSTRLILIDHRNSTPALDMCMMSLCDHMIITTGTYSWWAGFFSHGTVVRQMEFARNGSEHASEYRIDDYFPPSWIPL